MLREIKKLSSLPFTMTIFVGLIAVTSLRLHAPDLPVLSKTTSVRINSKPASAVADSTSAKALTNVNKTLAKRPYESASLKLLRKAAKDGRLSGSSTTRGNASARHSAVNKDLTYVGPNGTDGISLTAVRQLELRSSILGQSK